MGKISIIAILLILFIPFCITSCATEETPTSEYSPISSPPASTHGPGATFYVAADGNDANPGTLEAPWATPGYASRQLRAGDTLTILGGQYVLSTYDEDTIIPPSGTPEAWVTIKGEQGHRPTLAGRDNLQTAIYLEGVSYVRIENLEITHGEHANGDQMFFRDGVQIMSTLCSHIVLKDLYVHHIDEFGLDVQDVDDLQVLDCRFEYCGYGAVGGPNGEHGGCRNVLIKDCILSYSGHYWQGTDGANRPYDRPDGLGFEASVGPIEVVDTVAAYNYGDGLDSKCKNTTILCCIVANNSCDGVKLWGDSSRVINTLIYGRGDGDPECTPWSPIVLHTEEANSRFEVINTTVDDMLGCNYIMHVQYDYPSVPIKLTLINTIFRGIGEGGSPIYIGRATTLTAEHNLFFLPTSDYVLERGDGNQTDATYAADQLEELGTGNVYGDPLFLAPAWGSDGDYHLGGNSSAMDAGTTENAPSDDLQGHTRDAHPSIGAYE